MQRDRWTVGLIGVGLAWCVCLLTAGCAVTASDVHQHQRPVERLFYNSNSALLRVRFPPGWREREYVLMLISHAKNVAGRQGQRNQEFVYTGLNGKHGKMMHMDLLVRQRAERDGSGFTAVFDCVISHESPDGAVPSEYRSDIEEKVIFSQIPLSGPNLRSIKEWGSADAVWRNGVIGLGGWVVFSDTAGYDIDIVLAEVNRVTSMPVSSKPVSREE